MADEIKQIFGGEVARFVAQTTLVVGNGLEQRIQEQLTKLSPLELEIMYCLTVERMSTPTETLLQHRCTYSSKSDFLQAITSLRRRSLIYGIEDEEQEQLEINPTLLRHLTKVIVNEAVEVIIHALTTGEKSNYGALKKFRLVSPTSGIRAAQQTHLIKPIALKLAHYCQSDRAAHSNLVELKEDLSELTEFELGFTMENINALIDYLHKMQG